MSLTKITVVMVKNVLLGAVLVAVLALSGCNNDEDTWEKWRPIKVEAEGIVLATSSSEFYMEGTAPAEGGNFTLIAYSDNGAGLSLSIDDTYVWRYSKWDEDNTTPIYSSDWGEATYMIDKDNTIEIKLKLNPNESSSEKVFDFQLSGAYELVYVKITQAAE